MSITFLSKKNNAKSTLVGNILSSDLTLTVASATPFPTSNFLITIWDKATYPDPSDDPNMEILKVTAIAGSVLTVTRAQESTAATSHASGAAVEHLFTAGTLKELEDQINAFAVQTGAAVLYLGDPATNGSWRLTISSNNLSVQRLEAGVWNEKSAFTP